MLQLCFDEELKLKIDFIVYFRSLASSIADSQYKILIVKVPQKHYMNYDCD